MNRETKKREGMKMKMEKLDRRMRRIVRDKKGMVKRKRMWR